MSTLFARVDQATEHRYVDVTRDRRQAMSAIIPSFADAMIERHGSMASALAMQRAIDCHSAGDEYGENFWLWVSDLTSLGREPAGPSISC